MVTINYQKIQKKLGVTFNDQQLLILSLTHRSFLNEHKQARTESNERLEFLGDSILSFCISEKLYLKFPDYPEGILTNLRSNLVKTVSLATLAEQLKLGEYLRISHGEEESGGWKNPSILADTFEAVTGAIFLDQGLDTVKQFIDRNFEEMLDKLIASGSFKDPKSLLQEKIQAIDNNPPPIYKTLKEEGPDHQKIFTVGVFMSDKLLGTANGKSKREAEEKAAEASLKKLS
jgi:ribonuclease III